MKIVAIAGGTAAGKSTVARALVRVLGDQAAHMMHDWYYRTKVHNHNHDHPDSLETTLLVEHLDTLRRGGAVDAPGYTFATGTRHRDQNRVEPCPIIIVEGILLLADGALRDRFDHMFFIEAPDDIRVARRILRDVEERGQTVQNVVTKYFTTVKPMHDQFVVPSKAHAHMILDGTAPVETLVNSILNSIQHPKDQA